MRPEGLDTQLHGDLAAVLALSDDSPDKHKLPAAEAVGSQLSVVAGYATIVICSVPRGHQRVARRRRKSNPGNVTRRYLHIVQSQVLRISASIP